MIFRALLTAAITYLLIACSAEQVYSGLQEQERNRCLRGPQVEYDECMSRQEMDFDEYSRLAQTKRETSVSRSGNAQQVRDFVAAFNRQDISAMLLLTTHDIRWMSVDGDSISVETSGAAELRTAMQQYFANRPSSHSVLLELNSSGDFVTALEQAGSSGQRGQCATAVYEFSGQLIRNVWYYPAHDCEQPHTD